MASEEDVLLREVDEDLSRDQVFDRIRRYRIPAAVGAGAIILGVAGYQVVDGQRNAAAADAAAQYAQLSFAAPSDPSAEALTSFADGTDTGYAVLAQMRAASSLAQSGDLEGAAELYAAIYDDESVSGSMRDFARIRAAYTIFDTSPQRAGEIAGAIESEAFRGHADEIAAASALLDGNYAGAKARFDAIAASPTAADFLKTRARSFASLADAGANGASLEVQRSNQSEVVDFIRGFGAELEQGGIPIGVDPSVDVLPEPPIADLLEAVEAQEPGADTATDDAAGEDQ
ncbi:MAG: tetratricopeptide repeat protein [Pseudomonadota bacterium]